jgi:hypothetical protein
MFVPCGSFGGVSGASVPVALSTAVSRTLARRAFATDGAGRIVSLHFGPSTVGKVATIVVAFTCLAVVEKQKFPAAFEYHQPVLKFVSVALSGSMF